MKATTMGNIISMPVSLSHTGDRIKTNLECAAKNALVLGATGATAYTIAPKTTHIIAKDLFNGVSKFKPEAKTIIGKAVDVSKNLVSHTGTAGKALPSKVKIVMGAGLAASGILALNNRYEIGKIDGRHQTVKKIIQQTNGSGLYI